MKRLLTAFVLAVSAILVAGCTGIPNDSSPQVIRTVDRGGNAEAPMPNITPEAGENPRDIVGDFITAGVQADAGHSSSRQFLTTAAARKWQDGSAIVLDETAVGLPVGSGTTATVDVVGRRVGQIDASGVFSPTLTGDGTGDEETFTFALVQAGGQWRIDQLQNGVLLSSSQFSSAYRARKLFFFDPTEATLVPDLRYTPLQGPALASWLLTELLDGPRAELAQSVLNELPDQVGKPSVQLGDPIMVDLPGTAQLDTAGRNGLAAQLAYTIGQVQFAGGQLVLTDSGRRVTIPAASGTTFSSIDFNSVGPDSVLPGVQPYFIRSGAVISGVDGTPVPGILGQTSRKLTSVALRRTDSSTLQVAGVSDNRLLIGNTDRLDPVTLPAGALSRPEWRPYAQDAWVGVGTHGAIYRVSTSRQATAVSITSTVGSLPPGRVVALRFSADGVRLAVVLRAADGTERLWVGSVVTSGADVRIVSFEPQTPNLLAVSDVAWADSTKLLLVAALPGNETQVWQVQSDGSRLDSLTTVGLPGPPTSIAAALGRLPLVSASASIWTQRNSSWTSILGSTPSPGTNPVYAP